MRKTLASVLIILYIYVFDQGLYHDLYFEYGPSMSSVVGLKYTFIIIIIIIIRIIIIIIIKYIQS